MRSWQTPSLSEAWQLQQPPQSEKSKTLFRGHTFQCSSLRAYKHPNAPAIPPGEHSARSRSQEGRNSRLWARLRQARSLGWLCRPCARAAHAKERPARAKSMSILTKIYDNTRSPLLPQFGHAGREPSLGRCILWVGTPRGGLSDSEPCLREALDLSPGPGLLCARPPHSA